MCSKKLRKLWSSNLRLASRCGVSTREARDLVLVQLADMNRAEQTAFGPIIAYEQLPLCDFRCDTGAVGDSLDKHLKEVLISRYPNDASGVSTHMNSRSTHCACICKMIFRNQQGLYCDWAEFSADVNGRLLQLCTSFHFEQDIYHGDDTSAMARHHAVQDAQVLVCKMVQVYNYSHDSHGMGTFQKCAKETQGLQLLLY